MEARERTELLRRWALEEGFDAAGVARLAPSDAGDSAVAPEHRSGFLRWLEQGGHAGMEYMARRVEARLDPASLLPGARSALCVVLCYQPLATRGGDGGQPAAVEGDLWPRVARYSHGEDYHDVMTHRLTRLADRIQRVFPGCSCRPYVDTGPVLERELAVRAGLGAMGKNTNLLHPELGSWFLLGELLLTLDLEPGSAIADLCGSCRQCLDACPTGALPEPYRLDSNRCISYWTIEHRGVVPVEVREGLGEWVFGCDVCQDVCPLNADPPPVDHPELGLPPHRSGLDLAGLLSLSREEYVERFRGSAMKRAKLDGLQRNAAVAMGNRRSQRYVEPLSRALGDAAPLVRRHAAWALGRIGGARALDRLQIALEEEDDPEVRGEIEAALGGRCPTMG